MRHAHEAVPKTLMLAEAQQVLFEFSCITSRYIKLYITIEENKYL